MYWTDGYVSDIAYTTGFYRELAPSFLKFAAVLQGQHAPDVEKPFTYAELGCGQGFGTNILAAAYPHGYFLGIDFNPSQIANARGLAEEAQLENVTFRNESFQEAVALPQPELPEFDFITLHGIYAWISEANRQAIVQFIEQKLKPGGLVYVSYNCMPGWAAMAPFQRLLIEHAQRNPDRSDRQVEKGFAFVESLQTAQMAYFAQNPIVPKRIEGMKDKDKHYLAHEYLNGTWQPLFFTDVVREMSAAKLNYIGSATLLENIDSLTWPEQAREAVKNTSDPIFRELLKDYAINQQFRRDIFVKGARSMTSLEQQQTLQNMVFAPLKAQSEMSLQFKTPLGDATGQTEIYEPIANAIASGQQSIQELLAKTGIETSRLIQALAAMTSSGQIHPAIRDSENGVAQRLNQAVARRLLLDEPYRYLVAPAIANGINATSVEIIALELLNRQDSQTSEELAQGIWEQFRPLGRRLVKEGKVLQSESENLQQLRELSNTIFANRISVWKKLGLLK